ncbi:MAG: hypothetical protein ACXAC5_15210 [Promethearchaeota archaeon]|jgi:hypothetical protein
MLEEFTYGYEGEILRISFRKSVNTGFIDFSHYKSYTVRGFSIPNPQIYLYPFIKIIDSVIENRGKKSEVLPIDKNVFLKVWRENFRKKTYLSFRYFRKRGINLNEIKPTKAGIFLKIDGSEYKLFKMLESIRYNLNKYLKSTSQVKLEDTINENDVKAFLVPLKELTNEEIRFSDAYDFFDKVGLVPKHKALNIVAADEIDHLIKTNNIFEISIEGTSLYVPYNIKKDEYQSESQDTVFSKDPVFSMIRSHRLSKSQSFSEVKKAILVPYLEQIHSNSFKINQAILEEIVLDRIKESLIEDDFLVIDNGEIRINPFIVGTISFFLNFVTEKYIADILNWFCSCTGDYTVIEEYLYHNYDCNFYPRFLAYSKSKEKLHITSYYYLREYSKYVEKILNLDREISKKFLRGPYYSHNSIEFPFDDFFLIEIPLDSGYCYSLGLVDPSQYRIGLKKPFTSPTKKRKIHSLDEYLDLELMKKWIFSYLQEGKLEEISWTLVFSEIWLDKDFLQLFISLSRTDNLIAIDPKYVDIPITFICKILKIIAINHYGWNLYLEKELGKNYDLIALVDGNKLVFEDFPSILFLLYLFDKKALYDQYFDEIFPPNILQTQFDNLEGDQFWSIISIEFMNIVLAEHATTKYLEKIIEKYYKGFYRKDRKKKS